MEKRLIHSVIPFPAGNKPPVVSKPGNSPLNLPATLVTPKRPSILGIWFYAVASMRCHKLNALFLKTGTKFIRIIRFVADQVFRFVSRLIKRLVRQHHLMRRGRVKGHSQRNTFAVCQNHELCTLSPLSFADFWPPFLAGTKLPSIKHSAQLIRSFLSSSWIKALQILSQVPFSSQSFKRLQQVDGLGYLSGRSFHRAPVRRIQRIPSKTARLFFQGLPLLFNVGSKGSIFLHCFSVKYTARLIGDPPISYCIKERYGYL